MQSSILLLVVIAAALECSQGLYIKPMDSQKPQTADEWRSFQRQLGLSDQKLEMLRSQKDQKATMDLLSRFIKENPKYVTIPAVSEDRQQQQQQHPNGFLATYHSIVQQLRKAQGTLKTSLNFELADKSNQQDLTRSRRKIAVRMVSDMPSEKIDDLLSMFNQQHGLNRNDEHDDEDEAAAADDVEYNEIAPMPTAMDPEYMYENLYEDEEDAAPAKSSYGSFQDLIMQANRNQWQRELEETKLRPHTNEHFV